MAHPLEAFFWPRSIAVLGASPDPHRVRGLLLRHLRQNGFAGRILPINPSYTDIDGLPCFPTIAAVGGEIDLAVVAIPANRVAAAAEDCARSGVKHLVVISSGFAEQGDGGDGLQGTLIEIARQAGMRIAGPNCEGYYNALGRISTTFSPTVEITDAEAPTPCSDRCIGVIAQSGGIGFSLFNRGRAAGLAFSYVVSTGNEADLTAADFLDYMIEDPRTDAVMLFCETIREGARFLAVAETARRRGKPIVAIKIGRSEAGRRASLSHTAALSGLHTAYRAAFERTGIIEADDPDEAVAIAGMLATCPPPSGRRIGVVTASGGGGAWMADTLAAHGLQVPTLSAEMQAQVRSYTPSYASAQNPVDVTAQGGNTGPMVMRTVELLEGSDEVDSIVVVSSLASETRVMLDPTRMRPLVERRRKPVTVWSYTIPSAFGRRQLAACGLFLHVDLRACGIAMDRLAAFGESRAGALAAPATRGSTELPPDLPRVLPEYRAKALLAPFGLPLAGERLAGSAAEAALAAADLGFPVALKIQSADIPHKTEAKGVRLDLRHRAEVEAAWDDIIRAAARHSPDARIDGMLVQRMAPKGHELAIGMVNDAIFGPVMTVGFGGITIELFGDVTHRLAPVTADEAARMIRSLRSARLLEGFRGAPPVDIAPVAELVARLSEAATAHRDRIKEMEFNPVILHADGSGVTIADALVVLFEP